MAIFNSYVILPEGIQPNLEFIEFFFGRKKRCLLAQTGVPDVQGGVAGYFTPDISMAGWMLIKCNSTVTKGKITNQPSCVNFIPSFRAYHQFLPTKSPSIQWDAENHISGCILPS
jgi:hypothetical protein